MIKLLYKPIGMVVSVTGGLIAGVIFKRVWKIAAGEDEAPKATDEQRGWREILLAAALQGAIFALVKAAVDRGAAEGTRKLTGVWPGDQGEPPAERALRRPRTPVRGITMTRWTGRLLAAVGLGGRKPEGDAGLPADRRSRSPRSPVPGDVIAVIASQHEHVKKLLEAVLQETGHRRATAFHTLRLTLALHETAEAQVIHPQALHQLGPNDRAATNRIAEEQTAGQTIAALELADVDSDQFTYTFGHLATSVTDHAAAEESDEWPALHPITDPAVLNAMTEQMRAVTQLAEDPSAPGIQATFSEMQDWAKARLPAPPPS